MRVVTYRTVTHCREHNRQFEIEPRRGIADYVAVFIAFNIAVTLAERNFGFHRLSERINGRIGYLRSVDEYFIEIHGVFLGAAHRRKKHAAAFRLLIYLLDNRIAPVIVPFET